MDTYRLWSRYLVVFSLIICTYTETHSKFNAFFYSFPLLVRVHFCPRKMYVEKFCLKCIPMYHHAVTENSHPCDTHTAVKLGTYDNTLYIYVYICKRVRYI